MTTNTINKYALLNDYERDNLLDTILYLDKKVRHLFLQEMIEQIPNTKTYSLVFSLLAKDFFEGLSENEISSYQPLVKKMFDHTSIKTIFNTFDNYYDSFFNLLCHTPNEMKIFLDGIISMDKKKLPLFNGLMSDLISETSLINEFDSFKQLFCTYQDKLDSSIIKESLITSEKPLALYHLLSSNNKKIVNQFDASELESFLNYLISNTTKKENLPKFLKENELMDKLNSKHIFVCLAHNKKFLVDSLFTQEQIHEALQTYFWEIALINADNSKNYLKFIKEHLSTNEITSQLKTVIKNGVSLGNFHFKIEQSQQNPNAMITFVNFFYDELKSYLKDEPLSLLEQFVSKNKNKIYNHFLLLNVDNYTEKYDDLLINIEKSKLDKVMSQTLNSTRKKLKI